MVLLRNKLKSYFSLHWACPWGTKCNFRDCENTEPVKIIMSDEESTTYTAHSRWFSVGICKYKPVYKSHDMLRIRVLSLVENLFKKNPLQDLLSGLNTVISTNDSTRIITGHVIYNLTNSN